jgi:hypothetical protein
LARISSISRRVVGSSSPRCWMISPCRRLWSTASRPPIGPWSTSERTSVASRSGRAQGPIGRRESPPHGRAVTKSPWRTSPESSPARNQRRRTGRDRLACRPNSKMGRPPSSPAHTQNRPRPEAARAGADGTRLAAAAAFGIAELIAQIRVVRSRRSVPDIGGETVWLHTRRPDALSSGFDVSRGGAAKPS